MAITDSKREYSLDVLKIIATIIIIFHHYQQITSTRFLHFNFYASSFYFGYIVELFFVLSGMFMWRYATLIENEGLTFPKFMKRRYFRLIPLVAVGAIVYEILICIYPYFGTGYWSNEQGLDIEGTILDCLGIQAGWASSNPHVNNPTWYVSVLILCYVIFYFISYISRNTRGRIKSQYCYVIMIFVGLGINTYTINLPFMNEYSARGYVAFFFGVLLGIWLNKIENTKRLWWFSLILLFALTTLFAYRPELAVSFTLTVVYYPAWIIFFRFFPLHSIFSYRQIGELGKISFDVYIWHICLLILLDILIKAFHWNLNLNTVPAMISFTLVAFSVGAVSYYALEKPLNNFVERKIK